MDERTGRQVRFDVTQWFREEGADTVRVVVRLSTETPVESDVAFGAATLIGHFIETGRGVVVEP